MSITLVTILTVLVKFSSGIENSSEPIWETLEKNEVMSPENLRIYKSLMEKLQTRATMGRKAVTHGRIGPFESFDLFQGDMLLTTRQVKALAKYYEDKMNGTVTSGRAAMMPDKRWDRNIVYSIDSSTRVNESLVEAAIKYWTDNTCLNFTRDDKVASGDYMTFIKGNGCYSYVGRSDGANKVSIGAGCESVGAAIHEIAHSLGSWHEQSRPDRNKYISVHEGNIIKEALHNYDMMTGSMAFIDLIPYDYGSIMHYDRKGWSRSGQYAFTPRNRNYDDTVGQTDGPSFYDLMAINLAYCSDVCPKKRAYYRGYPNPKNCSALICPTGLGGDRCRYAIKTEKDVGPNTLKATSEKTSIKVEGVGTAYFFIKASKDKKVSLRIDKLNFICRDGCYYGDIAIQSEDMANSMARLCCLRSYNFVSAKNTILIRYRSLHKGEAEFSFQEGMKALHVKNANQCSLIVV